MDYLAQDLDTGRWVVIELKVRMCNAAQHRASYTKRDERRPTTDSGAPNTTQARYHAQLRGTLRLFEQTPRAKARPGVYGAVVVCTRDKVFVERWRA